MMSTISQKGGQKAHQRRGNTLTNTEVSALPPKKLRWLMMTLASSCLDTICHILPNKWFMLQVKILPEVDSTNKFSKDLSGEHEHGPGSQVYPNDNTHSAWTQHILKDIFAKILFCKKQLLFWTKYYENVKWSQPWSWGWCKEEGRCWSQRFEKASVCRQDASSQCGETDRLVETLDWSWNDGSIKKNGQSAFWY